MENATAASYEQAIEYIEYAVGHLICRDEVDLKDHTTVEYYVAMKLLECVDEIKAQKEARARGENPCNPHFTGPDRHPVAPVAAYF